MLKITDAITLHDHEVKERFVRAIGPAGQNPDKNATAVELRLDVSKSSLPSDVKERLIALGGRHVTADGVLVIVGREFRSQLRNREAARDMLVRLLKRAAKLPTVRTPPTPTAAARESRLAAKQRRSEAKRSRRSRDEQ
jgi:ribosome-associated protein